MTDLTPFGWLLLGLSGYLTIVGISYALLVKTERGQ